MLDKHSKDSPAANTRHWSPVRLARVEDYRAQVATLSLNLFYSRYLLHSNTPSHTGRLHMSIPRNDE